MDCGLMKWERCGAIATELKDRQQGTRSDARLTEQVHVIRCADLTERCDGPCAGVERRTACRV